MYAIVDSGSTKSSWVFIEGEEKYFFKTVGFNPYYQTASDITRILKQELLPQLPSHVLTKIFFYGAGCSQDIQKEIIKGAFEDAFGTIEIYVESDLLGAARALFHEGSGIACISGTGANTCLFSDGVVLQNVYSPGLALGDEGSGGFLGKLLARDYVRKVLPPDLMKKFEAFTTDRTEDILDNVYSKPFSNRYLASLAPFVVQNQEDPYMHNLAYENFEALFDQCICRYEGYQKLPIRFIGSIALHLKPVLEKVAKSKGASIDKVLQGPMEGLMEFHATEVISKQ